MRAISIVDGFRGALCLADPAIEIVPDQFPFQILEPGTKRSGRRYGFVPVPMLVTERLNHVFKLPM